ncbi:YfhO family protein, partial [Turicibacter sanguinis]|nr:YfhO family protein [Turicibacter sanguinis]
MLKRYLKEEKFTLLSFLILTLLIFSPYILHLKSFTLGFDYQNQHLYFYEEFHRLLSSGEAPFWSWNLFLGTNFIGSKTYYLLGDPFAYLTLLFPASKMMGAVFYITLL